jgi:hypothetical protein
VPPINGMWNNPADPRCNCKAAYRNMTIAESRASKATNKEGHLIIAYQCFDCGSFHIGKADESQRSVRQKACRIASVPKCVLCGKILYIRTDTFEPHPRGPVCRAKSCESRQTKRDSANVEKCCAVGESHHLR